jgi:hypothetical protein
MVAEQPPPEKLAKPIRAVLTPSVIRLLEDDKVFYEFWFRKQIPLAKRPARDAFAVPAVKEGTLLGALKVHAERYDFKDEEIPPGVYVLRLGLQPEDGDHLGTSPTRTFAMLIPADNDKKVGAFSDPDELNEASAVVNAAGHPSNLNLQPVESRDGNFPRLSSHNGGDFQVVYLRLEGGLKSQSKSVPLTFALVYDGVGEF